jgi:hypothetical protein
MNIEDIMKTKMHEPKRRFPKMTPWFGGDVKPIHVGVYEKRPHDDREIHNYSRLFSRWDGREWKTVCGEAHFADICIGRSFYQKYEWRGLADRPV